MNRNAELQSISESIDKIEKLVHTSLELLQASITPLFLQHCFEKLSEHMKAFGVENPSQANLDVGRDNLLYELEKIDETKEISKRFRETLTPVPNNHKLDSSTLQPILDLYSILLFVCNGRTNNRLSIAWAAKLCESLLRLSKSNHSEQLSDPRLLYSSLNVINELSKEVGNMSEILEKGLRKKKQELNLKPSLEKKLTNKECLGLQLEASNLISIGRPYVKGKYEKPNKSAICRKLLKQLRLEVSEKTIERAINWKEL